MCELLTLFWISFQTIAFIARRVDLGDMPAWISAITTFLALIAAVVAASIAHRGTQQARLQSDAAIAMLRVEHERDRLAEDERRAREEAAQRTQAEHVASWNEVRRSPDDSGLQRPDRLELYACITNSSLLPVRDVTVEFVVPTFAVVDQLDSIPNEENLVIGEAVRDVIPPGKQREITLAEALEIELADRQPMYGPARGIRPEDIYQVQTRLTFRDAVNRYWRRDEHGVLAETQPPLGWDTPGD